MKRKLLSIILIFTFILYGCGSTVFDASGYTKACLDAVYHEEYEAYVEFIGCSVEEAKTNLDQQSQEAIDNELSSLDINITEEQTNKYSLLLKEIEHLTKYEVGQAEETEDGFLVSVTIYPLDIYEQFLEGIDSRYQSATDAGELSDETIFPIMISYLEECIDNVQYKDALETTIPVTEDSEGIWHISENEMNAIDNLLLPGI